MPHLKARCKTCNSLIVRREDGKYRCGNSVCEKSWHYVERLEEIAYYPSLS